MSIRLRGRDLRQHRHETDRVTPYTPGSCKSTRKNFGSQPAHLVTFTCKDLWISGLPVENVEL